MPLTDLFSKRVPCQTRRCRPYIIAEAGVNHEGNMEMAKRLIDEAREGGADAIKFQTYRAATLASRNSPAYWDLTREPTPSQFQLFQKYDRFWQAEFEELKRHCDAAGIEFLSTPFDIDSARFLNDLMAVFKVSSSDITNKPFISEICRFGKPILLSTGASYLHEIQEAVEWITPFGNPLALLHCILNYPTPEDQANLGMILDLQRKFPEVIIGYSDHTLPHDLKILEVAVLLGAAIVEKHFTYDKTRPGNDHYHAMDKKDLKLFRHNLDRIFALLGEFHKFPLPTEAPARAHARRSLVAARDIPAGQVIEAADLTWKRPAAGISPKFIDDVLGTMALRNIAADEVIHWNMIN
jgi:sialic acid synthase SpsE